MVVRSTLIAGAMALIIGASSFGVNVSAQTPDIPAPVYDTLTIPQGRLTRGQFIAVVATRLFSVSRHDSCFRDLVGDYAPAYTTLFSDVSLTHPIATSVCVMMYSSLVRGSSNMLYPNQWITASEAAAIFSRLAAVIPSEKLHEPWYQRYMKTMHAMDPSFTFQPGDFVTGSDLRNMMCALKQVTPELNPNGDLTGC